MVQNRWKKTFIRVFKLSVHLKSQKINEISSHYIFSTIVGFSNGFQVILSVKDEITLQKKNCTRNQTHDFMVLIKEKQMHGFTIEQSDHNYVLGIKDIQLNHMIV